MTTSKQLPRLLALTLVLALAGAGTAGAVQIKGFAFKPATIEVNRGERGTFAFHCTIHPFMKGKVVVD